MIGRFDLTEVRKMRRFWFAALAVFGLMGALVFGSSAESVSVKGDYVEVRTASVFAGACHFNGEVVTAGREAIMAWNFASGSWNGTNLAGVRVIAVVSSDENLSNQSAARRSEVILDQSANHDQK